MLNITRFRVIKGLTSVSQDQEKLNVQVSRVFELNRS